ncbi:MAG: UvrD-helicase domain-containing protein [Balneolaceae bacterium]|nr:UvrD-helicase domain-containing protein [Balneolaceae bacterium]
MRQLEPFDIPLTGVQVVEASAGTGKTYSITSLYVRALIDRELTVEEVLVVTYTKAATKELRDRILRRIRVSAAALRGGETGEDAFLQQLVAHVDGPEKAAERLERALHDFDRSAIHTIHGFCNQVLQEQAFESGAPFDAEQVEDESEIIGEVLDDFWRRWLGEVEEEPWKEPLLRSLSERNVGPDRLARELGPHTGKPYLELRPRDPQPPDRETVEALQEAHEEMRRLWEREREEIRTRLLEGKVKRYTESYVSDRMLEMDRHLASNVATIYPYDKMARFSRDYLASKLKKGADAPPEHPFFEAVDRYLARAEELQELPVWFRRRAFDFLTERLEARKEELQVYSYDDMLVKVRDALAGAGSLARSLRGRYPLALVDEFQDTDPVQYDIFPSTLRAGGYGRREEGAGVGPFYDRRSQAVHLLLSRGGYPRLPGCPAAGAGRSGLGTQLQLPRGAGAYSCRKSLFRPPSQSLSAGGHLLLAGRAGQGTGGLCTFQQRRGNARPLPVPPSPGGGGDQHRRRRRARRRRRGLRDCPPAGGSRYADREGVLRAEHIAVLVRKHKQAETMAKALRAWDINSVQVSKESVFATPEAADLQQVLSAVAHPANDALVRAALATPLFGHDAADLLTLRQDEEAWTEELARFRRWNEVWDAHGFSFLFQSLLLEGGAARSLMRGKRGERRVTNLVHLGELLQEREGRSGRGHRSLLKWIARKRAEVNRETEEEQLRLESDQDLVRIVTMHRSKGLEYPVVFCPFLWNGESFNERGGPLRYHDGEDASRSVLDLRGKRDPERGRLRFLQAREELAESLRLAYVAMTRASHRCCLTWIAAGYPHFSALGYLLHEEETVLEALGRKVGDEKSNAPELDSFPAALRELAERHPDLIECVHPEPATPRPADLGKGRGELRPARSFDSDPPRESYRISSFSSLTGALHGEEEWPGLEPLFQEPLPDEDPEDETVYSFPRGPRPGTCLHNIFEKLLQRSGGGYPGDLHETVRRELQAYGIASRWEATARGMVRTVMEKELSSPDGAGQEQTPLVLAKAGARDRIPEMEFHFDTPAVEGRRLLARVRGTGEESLPPLQAVFPGFMKGFIDLTVRHEGRFYLVDYKSNHLGDAPEDYRRASLGEEILSAHYDLQYHLYTVALHRYLGRRLPDYNYEHHFGGVWYLFLRGIRPEGEEGLWFDRPAVQTVKDLDRMLGGGRHE